MENVKKKRHNSAAVVKSPARWQSPAKLGKSTKMNIVFTLMLQMERLQSNKIVFLL